jgi:hypothetical protein
LKQSNHVPYFIFPGFKFMERSSWQSNYRATCQHISNITNDTKIHFRVYKSLNRTSSWATWVESTLTTHFFQIQSIFFLLRIPVSGLI